MILVRWSLGLHALHQSRHWSVPFAALALTLPPTIMTAGHNDLGYANKKVLTPTIDELAGDGVKLSHFYTFKEWYVHHRFPPVRSERPPFTRHLLVAPSIGHWQPPIPSPPSSFLHWRRVDRSTPIPSRVVVVSHSGES